MMLVDLDDAAGLENAMFCSAAVGVERAWSSTRRAKVRDSPESVLPPTWASEQADRLVVVKRPTGVAAVLVAGRAARIVAAYIAVSRVGSMGRPRLLRS
jgi:hypothetical protein